MNVTHVPVLIVGAGAGGLSASALLAKYGVGSLLVEKRREVFIYPKARNLSFRSLEILRGLGLDDEVHAVADRVSDMVVKPTLNSTEEKLAIDIDTFFAGLDQLSPEPAVQYCPQSSLEPMLLAETRRHGNEVRYGTELCSLDQDDAGVTAVLRDLHSGESRTVRADYLVAADGVHSPIRNRLGLTTSGHGALPIYVVFIYFRAPWGKFVSHLSNGDGVQVKNADVDGIFLVVEDDLGMFITTYFPGKGETAAQFTPQRCREVLPPRRSVSRSTSRSSKSRRGNRTSRWPTNFAVGESFSWATPRTQCRHSRPGEPTPRFKARITWPGSWPQYWTGRRIRCC